MKVDHFTFIGATAKEETFARFVIMNREIGFPRMVQILAQLMAQAHPNGIHENLFPDVLMPQPQSRKSKGRKP